MFVENTKTFNSRNKPCVHFFVNFYCGYLCDKFIRNRSQKLGFVSSSANHMSSQRFFSMTFTIRSGLVSLLSLFLQSFVPLNTIQKVLTASAVFHMFDPDRDTFGEDAALNPLVDNDANGVLGDVENAASFAMVGLVGHTLLEGTVTLKFKLEKLNSNLTIRH